MNSTRERWARFRRVPGDETVDDTDCSPRPTSSSARWDPINPASPVTKYRAIPQETSPQAAAPAPQGFLGHLIARECSQEECRDGEARSGVGGGGGSPEGDRRGRWARPWGTIFGPAQARDSAASAARRGFSSPCRGSWGSRRRGPRSGVISFWSRARRAEESCDGGRGRRQPSLQAKVGELLMENELLYAKWTTWRPAALWPGGGPMR